MPKKGIQPSNAFPLSRLIQINHIKQNHMLRGVDGLSGHMSKQKDIITTMKGRYAIKSIVFCNVNIQLSKDSVLVKY